MALRHKAISPALAARAIRQARDTQASLVDLLLSEVSEVAVLKGLAAELGIRLYDLYSTSSDFSVDEKVLARADINFLRRFVALPLVDRQGAIVIAAANPTDVEMIDYLRARFPAGFSLVLSPRQQLVDKLAYFAADVDFGAPAQAASAPTPVAAAVREAVQAKTPIQEWVDSTLSRAVADGASDIHMLFQADKSLLLRFRVDGMLISQRVPAGLRPIEAIGTVLARCPTMDPANLKEPQDGTFTFDAAGRQVDARVAMLPQLHGPTVVIRLLDSLNLGARLESLGFFEEQVRNLRSVTDSNQGTCVVVGPTGSGKTTTLYAMLREVNAQERCVLTVEDPVEYRLPYVGQTEVRHRLGDRSLTFAKALRSILRLDPDVILVGEIRDNETAEVAMQAAITGHLVLSTLHANSALSAYPRLSNMGVPSYLVSEAVTTVVSQRLVRRLHECARPVTPAPFEVERLMELGLPELTQANEPVGCPGCKGSGYRGRIAVAEVLEPTSLLKSLIIKDAGQDVLTEAALEEGFTPIIVDAFRHVQKGSTSVAELVRVLGSTGDGQ